MEITFGSTRLQKICNSDKELGKKYGKNCAGKIRRRLDDLEAAVTLEVFRNLPGRCHELTGNRKKQLALDIEHPLRLIFEPNGEGVQKKEDGGLDWNSVKSVLIIEMVDYHG